MSPSAPPKQPRIGPTPYDLTSTTMSMTTARWKTIATGLGLGSLLLAACDPADGPDGETLAGTSEGATETGDEPPAQTETETDPGGSAEGQIPGETVGEPPGETEGELPPEPEPEPEACDVQGASRECTTEAGESGIQYCDGYGEPTWRECLDHSVCTPGETRSCGLCPGGGDESSGGSECEIYETCELYGGVPDWDTNHSSEAGCNTPLVLSFDGRPAELVPARAATFDLDGVGGCITTDWPQASTPWLALDRDGNGTIDSGRELFGSGTRLRSGRRAPHGFAALAELDDDGNGRIDAADEAFARLVLWGDDDGDRRSSFAEALPLHHHRILSIELGFHIDRQCDERGNCGVERAAFHWVDAHGSVQRGEVVDLHLACQ
jgi:hypothetical protein